MDAVTLETISKQAAAILAAALPFVYAGGKAVVDKSKDTLLEEGVKKLGSETIYEAKALLKNMSPKMSESLEKVLAKLSKNSEDPKSKEELQQEILNLLRKNPDLAEKINFTINIDIDKVNNLAVGNYNNFFNFGTPSGDELIRIAEYLDCKRKEIANQEILSYYNPSALPYYPDRLKQFVTENRADELRKALLYLENHRILLLSGVGGVGKTTLARALVDFRPVNAPEPFWFSFNQNQYAKLGDILEKLASYLNAPSIAAFKAEKREPGKFDVDKLTDELKKRSEIWLIFDDLDTMLEDRSFRDKGIEHLFFSLGYNTHNAKIIITSRILPTRENGESLIDEIEDEEKQHLNGLRTDFAIDYLSSNGLDGVESKKLKELAIGVDGHPLALKLLVKLVKEFGTKDTLKDLSMYRESKEDTILKARRLFDKLAGDEKELLERLSVYCEPVSIKGLKIMFTEKTSSNAVRKLIDKSLLETDHKGNYRLHPLVREFSYDDLINKKEAHLLAVKFYLPLQLPNPLKKEDLQLAIEAYHHACEAREYNMAVNIISKFNLIYILDLWGNSRTIIEICEKLLPNDHFKDKPILRDKKVHGIILGNLGNSYNNLGESRKAIEYYEKVLTIAKEIGDRHTECAVFGNLGNAYSNLGELRKAIEHYEKTLKIAKEIGDRRAEGAGFGSLGNTYVELGESEKAIEYYEEALKIAKEMGDKRGEGDCLGNLGNAYSILGEFRKAIEYHGRALIIAEKVGYRRAEGASVGSLGNAYHNLGESKKAIEYYEEALKIAKEIGDRRGEVIWLGNLGLAYAQLGEIRKAINCHKQELQTAKEIGDRHGECTGFANLGSAYSNLGEQRKAIEFFKKSLDIGKEIGNPITISFCEKKLKKLLGS